MAGQIARLHKPIEFNWSAKFGLPAVAPRNRARMQAEGVRPDQKFVCHSCAQSVSLNVTKFCWFNKSKFGGHVFCLECQKTV